MVVCAEKRSLRLASCWSVAVLNGAAGRRRYGFSSEVLTLNAASASRSESLVHLPRRSGRASRRASRPGQSRDLAPPAFRSRDTSRASNAPGSKLARRSQYSAETNAMRSRSRSTASRVATDCTLPAERPRVTFFHRTGDTSYPYSRSRIRLVSWASTSRWSMTRVSSSARAIASRVIS